MFAPFNTQYAAANQEVANLVQRYPQQFYGYVFVHPQNDAGQVYEMVKKFVQGYGFKGIKVHKHDGGITREICEVAKIFNIPILYDVMGEFWAVELLANEYPSVNFIIPHLGSFADDWRMQLAFIPLLERYPNIFTDTSGVRRFDLLERAVQQAGASKILFGTDGPWLHPKVELEKVFALKLSNADTQLILADNFLKLIKNTPPHLLLKPKNGFNTEGVSKIKF